MNNRLQPFTYQGTMISWYDGDSPTVDIDLGFKIIMHAQKVRLFGVNTPELRGEEREKGLEVRDLVRLWVPPQTPIVIRTHKDKSGKYGRWLAEIFLEDMIESVNQRLLANGLAEIEAYSARERARIEGLMGVTNH